ncbi:MAG TPA: hypothetical protein VHD76_13280 [Bryobacteraceae bacterium]|jgi:hypothetical protein|nr:hypothetical protein [Bryobacteraceae bacterium]
MTITFPTSVLQAGLFPLGSAPVKVADLATIPESALTVTVRALGTNPAPITVPVDGCAKDAQLLPEQSVELPLAEMDNYSFSANSDGDAIVITYVVPMGTAR